MICGASRSRGPIRSKRTGSPKEIKVKEVDIQGHFKGVSEDIYVEGQGSALGAALEYRFNLIDESAQKIMANMKGAHFSDCLLYTSPSPRD